MKTTQYTWKSQVAWLAKFVANCNEELTVLDRERTPPTIPTVYVLSNSESGDIFYVGHSVNLTRRILQHKQGKRLTRFPWDRLSYFDPGIKSLHKRLQVEGILQILAVPEGVQLVSLRRLKNMTWKEWKRWTAPKWKYKTLGKKEDE